MIKGEYVGTVKISFSIPDGEKNILPYEDIKRQINSMSEAIKGVLEEEVSNKYIDVSVETIKAEIEQS